jgi:hypothetical protein
MTVFSRVKDVLILRSLPHDCVDNNISNVLKTMSSAFERG